MWGRLVWGWLASSALILHGCNGSAPGAVEVTEPWTSGDEAALGVAEPAVAEPPSEASSVAARGDEGAGAPTSR